MKIFRKYTIFQKKGEKKDEALLVAAAVIAAMAYQAAITPPGGVATMDAQKKITEEKRYSYELEPSRSLLAYFDSQVNNTFWIANTISLVAALSVIFLYVSGFSLKRHIQIWFLRVAMWITLTSVTVAYVCAVIATNPTTDDVATNPTTADHFYYDTRPSNTAKALMIGMIAWVGLLTLSLIFLGVRFLRYLFTNKKKSQVASKKKNTSEVEIAADIV